ncbi:MAG: phosphoglucosamine mutase [Armatimonadetes bacterium]|nr:phosphoglucosamine mutase [Armatimonadota bacterium]
MRPLKLSMLGVRGVVGETLTPELIIAFAQAFGTYVGGGTVLVSRDPRSSGPMVASSVFAGLLATGCRVVDLGICPTPALQHAVRDSDATGGVAVSAGHNAEDWNALKFVNSDGLFLNAYQGEELLDIYHQGEFDAAGWQEIRLLQTRSDVPENHVQSVLDCVDAEAIRKRGFRVAVDCCNGACSLTTPRLLDALDAEAITINDRPEPPFPHDPEPTPRTMSALRALVTATGADFGFAHDADGERLGLVTDTGVLLSEEYTLCLLADAWLAQEPGPVVCNVSTTLAMDAIAARHGVPLHRTRVGQAHVVEGIRAYAAVIGGEGSGGVVFPKHLLAHDSLAAAAYLMHFLARDGGPLSKRAARIPVFHAVKERIELGPERAYSSLYRYREAVEDHPDGAELDWTEGVRKVWRDANGLPTAAVHVRASITEPFIRVIAEATDVEKARTLAEEATALLRTFL